MTGVVRIVLVPIEHPDVVHVVEWMSPDDPQGIVAGRQHLAQAHRVAARLAARHAAALVVDDGSPPSSFSITTAPGQKPRLDREESGRTIAVELGVSLSHGAGWGAAMVWAAPTDPAP